MFKDLNRTLVIAEIGNNHEGDMGAARELVDRAAETGVDAVKFQTFITEKFTAPLDPARFARLQKFQLSFDDFAELADRTRSHGLQFISTPLDLDSARFLGAIVDAMKIASGDNTYWSLIDIAARAAKPLIISTGISGRDDIAKAAKTTTDAWADIGHAGDLALLHCIVSYPAPPEFANLRAIPSLAAAFPGHTIGYSDHTMGLDAAVLSVALGARVIEKHFTLANDYSDFRDHQLSADPEDMKRLVKRVRTAEALLGPGDIGTQDCERDLIQPVRRSVAAARAVNAGETIGADDIVCIRPGGGIPPGEENRAIGRKLKTAIAQGAMITPDMLDAG